MKNASELVAAWPNADEVLKGTKYEDGCCQHWLDHYAEKMDCMKRSSFFHIITDAKSNAAAVVTGNAVLREFITHAQFMLDEWSVIAKGAKLNPMNLNAARALQNQIETAQAWLNKQESN